ncbi:MAG: hypothetical protein P8X55_13100 [Desulfosarcinaceae bacterium]
MGETHGNNAGGDRGAKIRGLGGAHGRKGAAPEGAAQAAAEKVRANPLIPAG